MEIINKENFDSKVEKGVVLVDFFANWCMPCKMLSPVLEEASELFGDKVSIYKVDVDQCPNISRKYGVMSIPNLIIFEHGQVLKSEMGFKTKEELKEFLEV